MFYYITLAMSATEDIHFLKEGKNIYIMYFFIIFYKIIKYPKTHIIFTKIKKKIWQIKG